MKTSFIQSKVLHIFTFVLVVQAVFFYTASHGELVPSMAPLTAFPSSMGDWKLAQEGVIDKESQDVLKADDLLTRWYVAPEGGANLFIAFFKTQRTGQSPHSPKNCLPGSGWQPSQNDKIDVPVASGNIRVNRYVVSKGDAQSVVMYWYQSHGRVIADEFAAKFYLVADSIKEHRSDTSLVRVVVPIQANQTDKAMLVATDFVKTVYPVVSGYLPH